MPASDSPALIVARYLRANHPESYSAFVSEANLAEDAGVYRKGDLTLEELLEEKKTFDISVKYEKLNIEDDGLKWWKKPAPSQSVSIERGTGAWSNILCLKGADFRFEASDSTQSVLLASTADRRVHMLDAQTRTIRPEFSQIHDSPILSMQPLSQQYILMSSMSGHLYLSDLHGKLLDTRHDHTKYLIKVTVLSDGLGDTYLATAGWDSKVCIYKPVDEPSARLGEPKATIDLPTKPEGMAFTRHPDNGQPVIILSRTDSSCIFFYAIEEASQPRLLGRQNLAPHSNAWVAFTPSALELCPTDPGLLAIGTSSVPHMKLLIARLLFPPWRHDETTLPTAPARPLRISLLDDTPVAETQASQAQAALVVADREDAAIQIHCTTMAPQTPYSTPAVAWRPDGSGVWVNGDDGAVRGIEASTGKVVSTLRGHEAGSKVRCLWAGGIRAGADGQGEGEVLVSGGFDQKIMMWDVEH